MSLTVQRRRRRGLLPLLWLLFTVAAAACASSDGLETTGVDTDGDVSDEGQPLIVDQESLDGTSWTLRFGGGPEGDVVLVDGYPITLNFDGDTLGGTAACNGYGSTYSIGAENRITIDGLGWSQMGCQPDVQAAEQAYLAALTEVETIDLAPVDASPEGRGQELALSGGSSELIFEANAPVPSGDLIGSLWLLDTLINGETAATVAGEPATLQLNDDGTGSASTGCRSLTGRYIITGNEVVFTDLAADGDCPDALFDQDSHVISVIGDGFEPTVDGDRLTLTSQGGIGLAYRSITEDELGAAPSVPVPSDADVLDGIEWILAGGDSPDGPITDPRAIDPDQPITLVLSNGEATGKAICNSYGAAAVVGNGSLEIGEVASEEEGCGDQLDAIAAAYYRSLPLMTEFGLENGSGADANRLVMNGSDVELWFERAG